jgi:hypothetical protein
MRLTTNCLHLFLAVTKEFRKQKANSRAAIKILQPLDGMLENLLVAIFYLPFSYPNPPKTNGRQFPGHYRHPNKAKC